MSATSRPWGWKLTLHVYGSGEQPSGAQIQAAAKAAQEAVEADDFVGADICVEQDSPRDQGAGGLR